jgi:hypothetical protein
MLAQYGHWGRAGVVESGRSRPTASGQERPQPGGTPPTAEIGQKQSHGTYDGLPQSRRSSALRSSSMYSVSAWRQSILVVVCVLALGCGTRDDLVVWKAELPSPDRIWLATADTVQNGGFGTAEIHTTVFLQGRNTKVAPQEVFVVECQGPIAHPYTLDNVANKGGCVGLTMAWLAPKQLHLSYEIRQGTRVVFQVVKLSDVDITVEPRPAGPILDSSPYWRRWSP